MSNDLAVVEMVPANCAAVHFNLRRSAGRNFAVYPPSLVCPRFSGHAVRVELIDYSSFFNRTPIVFPPWRSKRAKI